MTGVYMTGVKHLSQSELEAVMDKVVQSEHSEMVTALVKPATQILDTLCPAKVNVLHMTMGIVGEAGELSEAIKKYVMYNKKLDRKNIIEELGDLEFYMEGLRQQLGIRREETLMHNREKLLVGKKARYKEGTYSDIQAQTRQDKKE